MITIPVATYRLQFRPDFGFAECAAILPYLSTLGISHVYASPIFQSRRGSPHGYDGVDPNALNTELGPPEAWETLAGKLRDHRIHWLQDIVPNHMAYHADNRMLADVFENGAASPFYRTFDINWEHPAEGCGGRVLAPFLARRYSECLEAGEIRLEFGETGFQAAYFGLKFPLRIDAYLDILDHRSDAVETELETRDPDAMRWVDLLDRLESLALRIEPGVRNDDGDAVKQILWELYCSNAAIRSFIDDALAHYNPPPGDLDRFRPMDRLLSRQWFRLCCWKDANQEINYRRFFDINELIALRQEDDKVFDRTHRLLTDLVADGIVDGVRIDHIDGLADPGAYLRRLRRSLGDGVFMLVEKILDPDESLPSEWPVQGTTGYDFAHWLNAMFVKRSNSDHMDAIYAGFSRITDTFADVAAAARSAVLHTRLAGDLTNLCRLVKKISAQMPFADNLIRPRLQSALAEILIHFPVYRTYLRPDGIDATDRKHLETAVARAIQARPEVQTEIEFIRRLFLGGIPLSEPGGDGTLPALRRQAIRRFQQLSATLMAKGIEDTAFYRYHRLVSLNEVGGDPSRFGCSLARFHAFIQRRSLRWPNAINATATHDTKRGEDVRARLNVLSEIPHQWEASLDRWYTLLLDRRLPLHGKMVPDRNTACLLFQTLIGVWPQDASAAADLLPRVRRYMIKAAREAGRLTSWTTPCNDYETALSDFIGAMLDPTPSNRFLSAFVPFCEKIAFFGRFNTLSQCLIKITAPGIPDFYQGAELMQLDLVDPDNRRRVDFTHRQQLLEAVDNDSEPRLKRAADLLADRNYDRLKLFVIARALEARKAHRQLFESGDYQPLTAVGGSAAHVIAFARKAGDAWCIVAAPRFLTDLADPPDIPVGDRIWRDTVLDLPPDAPRVWRDAFTGRQLQAAADRTPVGVVLAHFPVSLLIGETTS